MQQLPRLHCDAAWLSSLRSYPSEAQTVQAMWAAVTAGGMQGLILTALVIQLQCIHYHNM